MNKDMINFDISKCKTLITIEDKLLELSAAEKRILENYKDSDRVLQPQVYNQLYNIVTGAFNDCRKILFIRRDALLKQKNIEETTAQKMTEIKETSRAKIENRYEIRLLRYKNKLFKRQCALEYKIQRKAAINDSKKIIAPLLEKYNTERKNLPP